MNKKINQKVIRIGKGAISVLLCLVITPFLVLAASLVELHRYQTTVSTLQELIDCSSLSALADYDPYLSERFGLLALSQDSNPDDVFQTLMTDNLNIMGQAITPGVLTANPSNALSSVGSEGGYDVLRKQITDFSEMTVTTEVFMSELKIDELMDKLKSITGLSKIAGATSALADLTSSVEALVTSADALITSLNTVQTQVGVVQGNYNSLLTAIEELLKKVSEDGFVLESDEEDEAVLEESYKNFISTYSVELKKVTTAVTTLATSVSTLGTQLDDIPVKISALTDALDLAKKAVQTAKEATGTLAVETAGGEDLGDAVNAEEAAEAASSPMELVVEAIEGALQEVGEQYKKDAIDTIKSSASSMVSSLKTRFFSGTKSIFNTSPPTANAKALIDIFLALKPETWTEEGKPQLRLDIISEFISETVSFESLGALMGAISENLSSIVEDAKNSVLNNLSDSITDVFSGLVKSIEDLFNLDGFYNSELNAFLSNDVKAQLLSDGSENPFQTLLDSLCGIFDAAEDLKAALSGDWTKLISAVITMFTSVATAIQGLIEMTQNFIDKITEVVGYFNGSNQSSLYDLLLMSSYMTYNLPNRTSMLDGSTLKGTALTGYAFKDIPVLGASEGGVLPGTGIQGLLDFIADLANGGSDDMFKGAELEYIIAGTQSEVMNQAFTFFDVYFIRMILDIAPILFDPNVGTMAATFNIASWVIYILVVLGEPLCDTLLLVNGVSVPIIKKSCYLTPVGVLQLLKDVGEFSSLGKALSGSTGSFVAADGGAAYKDFASVDDLLKVNYRTYCLLIIMFTVEENDILERFADIVQLESTRYYQQFDIDKTYTTLETNSTVTFNSLFNFIDVADTGVFTQTITRERGY